jgi:riboflavin kinase / FMN adenylyltransferase
MKVFRGFDEVKNIKNPVITTGSFDGVHIGHKTILNRLKMLAEKHYGESVLITFYPHPRKVLYPETAGKNLKFINSQEEKLALLTKAGIDNLIIVEFTKEFSKITSEEFVRDFLAGKLKAKVVVAGFNHHFGFKKEGDYHMLWDLREKYNFMAEEIPEQEVQHETVSSTTIRQAISEGYIQRANAYLDHYYLIIGVPEKYSSPKIPCNFLFYKVPITEESKLLPSPGFYAISSETETYLSKGLVIIDQGAIGKTEVLLLTLEKAIDLHGKKTSIFFHKKIFGSIDFSDTLNLSLKLSSAINEINDLIY